MHGPLKLFGNLLLATFRISGYFVVCIAQTIWYAVSRKPDKIGDALGYFGRGTVDAISDIFR